jgi:hypothetical protein
VPIKGAIALNENMKSVSIATLFAFVALLKPTQAIADGIEFLTEKKANQHEPGGPRHVMPMNIVDQQLFGGMGTAENARKRLVKKLQGTIQMMVVTCELQSQQQEKIELAGMGDIHLFMRECLQIRDRVGPNNRNINNIWQELQPLQQKLHSGLHGEDSMFDRTLRQSLDRHQATLLEKRQQQANERKLELMVRQMVNQLDQVSAMDARQRRAVTTFLQENVAAPKRVPRLQQSNVMSAYVLYRVSQLPETKLKEWESLFDEDEKEFIDRATKIAMRYEVTLKKSEMID